MEIIDDIIYLIGCAVNQTEPDSGRVKDMDLHAIFVICCRQGIAPIVYYGIKNINDIDLLPWKTAYYKNLKTYDLMQTERNEIFKFMDKNYIWRLPLKGLVIQNYYPHPAMREMSDNDILYDAKYEDDLNKYMLNNGYEHFRDDRLNDYKKKPCYHFEMHRIIYNEHDDPKRYKYYKNFKEKFIGHGLEKHLSPEDFYIYQIVHHLWHDHTSGSGLRPLIDMYLLLKNENLDQDYINVELKKLGADEFEKEQKNLALKLFKNPQDKLNFTQHELNRLNFISKLSAYGSVGVVLDRRFKNMKEQNISLLRYAFPSLKFLQDKNIHYAKHKALLPIYWARYNYARVKNFQLKRIIYHYKKFKSSNNA